MVFVFRAERQRRSDVGSEFARIFNALVFKRCGNAVAALNAFAVVPCAYSVVSVSVKRELVGFDSGVSGAEFTCGFVVSGNGENLICAVGVFGRCVKSFFKSEIVFGRKTFGSVYKLL